MLKLSTLNPNQLSAVTANLKPILVSAGAGSGKTRVLAYRIAYLIDRGLVSPEQILALTFTNKAAKEMQDRVQTIISEERKAESEKIELNTIHYPLSTIHSSALPTMGTFHSIGARVLREHGFLLGLPKGFTIFDDDDSARLIKRIAKELEVPEKLTPSWLQNLVSSAKNALSSAQEWQPNLSEYLAGAAKKVFENYEIEIRRAGGVDFDDLIVLPVKLWRENAAVLEYYQNKFNYILVDEYQDTNAAQYQWLKLLVSDGKVFAVGDDAQSIYGFRGSDFSNWKNFQRDFAPCEIIHLEQNYRSTQNILDASGKVLASSDGHTLKQLWTEGDTGEKVCVHELLDESDEAVFVAKSIARLAAKKLQDASLETTLRRTDEMVTDDYGYNETSSIAGGLLDKYLAKSRNSRPSYNYISDLSSQIKAEMLKDIAILYRTHGQSRAIEEVLISANIPYRIIGGIRFYQRREIKDLLAMLRLLVNPQDFISLDRVVSVLPLGLGEKSLPHLADALSIRDYTLGQSGISWSWDAAIQKLANSPLQSGKRDAGMKLFAKFSVLSAISENNTVAGVLREIIKNMDLTAIVRDGTEQGETRWENIQELINVARVRYQESSWQDGANRLLEEAALLSAQDDINQLPAVQLMTIHAAKGLEFDNVIVTGWEEGVLPHARSLWKPDELAEEVRLAYVAMTRARKKLILTFARSRALAASFGAKVPSRFLRHLPDEAVSWHRLRRNSIVVPNSEKLTYEAVDEDLINDVL